MVEQVLVLAGENELSSGALTDAILEAASPLV